MGTKLQKKILAIAMILMLLLSQFSTTVFAVTEEIEDLTTEEEIVEELEESQDEEEEIVLDEEETDDEEDTETETEEAQEEEETTDEETLTYSIFSSSEGSSDTLSISSTAAAASTSESGDFILGIDTGDEVYLGTIEDSWDTVGHDLHYALYNGTYYMAFCLQLWVDVKNDWSTVGTDVTVVHNASDYEQIAKMVFFGYTSIYGTGIPTTKAAWSAAACTQQYIWDYIYENVNSSYGTVDHDSWNSSYMSSSIYEEWLEETEEALDEYYNNEVSFDGNTYTVGLGESTTITDKNGSLQYYPTFSKTVSGVTFSHTEGENTLTITVKSSCTTQNVTFDSEDYDIYKETTLGTAYDDDTMCEYIHFKESGYQNLLFSNYLDAQSFSVSVKVEYNVISITKVSTGADLIKGAKIGIYSDSDCTDLIDSATTTSSGKVTFDWLEDGTYYIKEISAPDGYIINTESYKVTVSNGAEKEIEVIDDIEGSIAIEKTDEETGNESRAISGEVFHGDATLEGAVYTLYAEEDIVGTDGVTYFEADEEIATYTFDEEGQATAKITNTATSLNLVASKDTVDGLAMGTYYVQETTAPEGYTLDETKYSITLSYEGKSSDIVDAEITVYETVEKAKFEVIKVSTNTSEVADVIEGAEFTAILTKYVDYYGSFDEALEHLDEMAEDEYSIFTTDSDGHGVSGYLAYGNYTVSETITPSSTIEAVEDFTITIDEDGEVIKEVVVNNAPFEAFIKLIKYDYDSGETVTYTNATFKLYKLDEETNEWEEVGCKVGKTTYYEWTTDEEGIAYTETKLEAGTYKVEEITIPEGFLALDDELTFEVSLDNDTVYYDEDYDAYITVAVTNQQPKGELVINKSVSLEENADVSLVNLDYTGIEFTLWAAETIIDYTDGEVIYNAGDTVGVYSLSQDGTLDVTDLWMGSYTLQETKTIDGLVLDETVYNVEFTKEDDLTKVYTVTLDITNETTVYDFTKVDTSNEVLTGTVLTLYDSEGNIVYEWTVGEDKIEIEGLTVGETYTLVETETPQGYVTAKDMTFTVENTEDTVDISMIDKVFTISKVDIAGEDLEGATLTVYDEDGNVVDEWTTDGTTHYVENLKEGETYTLVETVTPEGYVTIEDLTFTVSEEKTDEHLDVVDEIIESVLDLYKEASSDSDITGLTAGTMLANATFEIYDEDGNYVTTITTDENGLASITLEYGVYTIKEVAAPDYYLKDEDKTATIEVVEDGAEIELVWGNEAVELGLEITKTGIEEAQANDEIKYEFTIQNNSNVDVDNFTWTDELPYEYITLTKLFTGTYNYEHDYRVYYQLVETDEWIEIANEDTDDGTYSTLENNFIDFTDIDGTVARFKVEFGTVEQDFASVDDDTPFIYCKVNSTVVSGDEWTNYTYLTGTYTTDNGTTVELEDIDKWTTSTYAYALDLNGLPTTGR